MITSRGRHAILNSIKWGLTPLIFLTSCTLLDPHNLIGRQMGEAQGLPTEVVPPTRPRPLDAAARERAFEFVWDTIDERYHDPGFNGVDWRAVGERYRPLAMAAKDDDAFWDVLDRMTGELHDSHTRVESPKKVELRKRDQSISLGFSFLPVEGKLAVAFVNRESDAWWAGVRPGMTLARIDGEPAQAVYDRLLAEERFDSTDRARHLRAVRRIIFGEAGTRVAFTFERADGTRFDVSLARRRVEYHPASTHRVLPSGFGYLRMSSWTLGVAMRALERIDELSKTPGLIIDLRGNPGGSVHAVNEMLEKFFTRRTEVGRTTTRTGKPVSLLFGTVEIIRLHREVSGSPDAYTGPVVILVDALSASGSELFAGTMQATGRAKVAGQPSCGCLLGYLGYAHIPGGAELAYSEVGFVTSNGKRIEGEGVVPDVTIPVTLHDLQLGRDRVLERAQEMLKSMPKWQR
jgi:carboxyl-terminal processing protease